MKDLYKILGVSENASDDAIKKAYRKLAKELHPDVTGGDKKKTERFKEINDAYQVLGDAKRRAEYDRLRHAPVGADGMPQGFDPELFSKIFGGGIGGGGPFHGGVRVETGGGDFGDFFSSLFGGAGQSWSRGRARRGADVQGRLGITFREAALGTRKTVRSGSGAAIEVNVPAGVETGGRLRVPGQGVPAPGGAAGDLHLEIEVAPDPVLRRSGDDVEMSLPLSIREAILGTKVDVPTVDGSVTLSVPPGTSSGAKLRLRGKGIRRPDGGRGDQLCRVEIVAPKLGPEDAETRKLVEDLDRRAGGGRVRTF